MWYTNWLYIPHNNPQIVVVDFYKDSNLVHTPLFNQHSIRLISSADWVLRTEKDKFKVVEVFKSKLGNWYELKEKFESLSDNNKLLLKMGICPPSLKGPMYND